MNLADGSTRRITQTWLLLSAATVLSVQIGTGSAASRTAATAAVLVIALIKVRLVIWNFMEVRDAPRPLRLVCDLWIGGTGISLMLMYVLRG